jgi:hypothetical protein
MYADCDISFTGVQSTILQIELIFYFLIIHQDLKKKRMKTSRRPAYRREQPDPCTGYEPMGGEITQFNMQKDRKIRLRYSRKDPIGCFPEKVPQSCWFE